MIVDDGLPAVAGTNRVKFTSVLFGVGSIAAGEGNMPNTIASEMVRDPMAGNGGGQDTIISRRTDIILPVGFSWTDTSVAGQSASYTELAKAANWTHKWDAKNIPLAFLVTNG